MTTIAFEYMLKVFTYTLLSVIIVSLISFVGVFSLFFKRSNEKTFLLVLVGLSAGALFGDAVLHLLPQAVQTSGFTPTISLYVLLGVIIFFILEKFVHWHHCHGMPASETHKGHEHPKHIATMNLVGDALHNSLDGFIIAASYLVSIPLGIATTLAVILHEVPQEIADFGILLYSGLSRKKALFYNFLSATTAIAGAIIGLIIGSNSEIFVSVMVPFSAGAFLYIAGSNLIPELQKEVSIKQSIFHVLAMILGIAIMVGLLFLE